MEVPTVGLHIGVADADYFSWKAISHSIMDHGLRSMVHFKEAIDNPEPLDSVSVSLGTATHYAMFAPDEFSARVVKSEKFDRRTNVGKAAAAEFEAKHAGKVILDPDDYERLDGMRAALAAHPTARKLIGTAGPTECAVVWTDEETGLLCKAKLDKFVPKVLALDLKTCADASPASFARSVARYGYHRQIAHYYDGFSTVSEPTPFCIVAVENAKPYAVAVYTLDDDAVAVGRSQNRRLLREIAACRKAGEWPGYPTTVQALSLPAWASGLDAGGLPKIEDDGTSPF